MLVHCDGGMLREENGWRWPEVAGPRILTSLNVNRWEDIHPKKLSIHSEAGNQVKVQVPGMSIFNRIYEWLWWKTEC